MKINFFNYFLKKKPCDKCKDEYMYIVGNNHKLYRVKYCPFCGRKLPITYKEVWYEYNNKNSNGHRQQ